MTEVAANYNINVTKVTTNDMKMDESAQVDAILKTLQDEKIWKSMMTCDDKNKIMLGGAPAPGVGLPIPIPEPVFPNDPQAIDIAKWAAAQHKREYVKLLGGFKWNFMLGTLYALLINNKDDKHNYTSGAVVLEIAITGTKIFKLWIDIIVN